MKIKIKCKRKKRKKEAKKPKQKTDLQKSENCQLKWTMNINIDVSYLPIFWQRWYQKIQEPKKKEKNHSYENRLFEKNDTKELRDLKQVKQQQQQEAETLPPPHSELFSPPTLLFVPLLPLRLSENVAATTSAAATTLAATANAPF